MTHNKADDPGNHPQQAESRSSADVNSPGSEAMLRMWVSWMEAIAKTKASGFAGNSALWPQAMPDDVAGGLMAEGLQKWTQALAQDPVLHSIDGMWNANPLREVVPVDWAEIVRSLRTVWVRSLSDPERAVASFAELNARLVQSAMEIWGEAARKWAGVAGADAPRGTADRCWRQAVCRSGMAGQSGLPHPQRDLLAGFGLAAEAGRVWRYG